jgi:hypothetical protein
MFYVGCSEDTEFQRVGSPYRGKRSLQRKRKILNDVWIEQKQEGDRE